VGNWSYTFASRYNKIASLLNKARLLFYRLGRSYYRGWLAPQALPISSSQLVAEIYKLFMKKSPTIFELITNYC
jgi:hypothetical protein